MNFQDYLCEIGDSRKPYKIRLSKNDRRLEEPDGSEVDAYFYKYIYRFTTIDKIQYFVTLDTETTSPWGDEEKTYDTSVSFATTGTKGGMFDAVDQSISSAFRVVATVIDAVKAHIDAIWKKDKAQVTTISFESSRGGKLGSDPSDKKGDQRAKLYKAFAKKEIPGVKFTGGNNHITMIIPKRYYK